MEDVARVPTEQGVGRAALGAGGHVSRERAERATRLQGYFDLQLRFAEAVAEATARPLPEAVLQATNLYRRFGLGWLQRASIAPAWDAYTATLMSLETHAQRVAWTQAFFVQSPPERLPPSRRRFGCFDYDPPDENGIVRIHFMNRDTDDSGPLGRSKIDTRRHELKEMFTCLRQMYAGAKHVRGTSWLYHIEAYRRLFPPVYGGSRHVQEGRVTFQGSSSWGQFLDHREGVKADLRERFLQNLARLDVHRLWEVFPLPTYRTEAPIKAFYDFYEVR